MKNHGGTFVASLSPRKDSKIIGRTKQLNHCRAANHMSSSENPPKLRMAPAEPPEPAELLERRVAREKLDLERRTEFALEQSLAPFRVGSVDSLNAVPLTRGLESEIKYAWPSQLATMLQRDELDAALVSLVEVLFTDRYDVLDGIAIASLGEVRSVFLAHRKPLAEVREVFCDPASLTSVSLLKVLLAERGLSAEFKPLPAYEAAPEQDAVLLIGDRALDFSFAGHPHTLWDLGGAWSELTNLPFVYAVWALRRIPNAPLRRTLREARDFGLDTLDHIINSRTEYTREFRQDYLGWHIHYHLGTDEKRGIARFMALLEKHGLGRVHEPRFVS
jgi:chorismate dehydratase